MIVGSITVFGDRLLCQTDEYLTGEHSKRFLKALLEEVEEKVLVVLDNAPYFQSSIITGLFEGRDDLELPYLPPYSPDLNPVEVCWCQLHEQIGNWLYDSLTELQQ